MNTANTKTFCLLGLLLASAGCTTVEISSPGTLKGVDVKGAGGMADRAIMVGNEGYFLFQRFPLVTGDVTWCRTRREIDGGIVLFRNGLSGDRMMTAICSYADSMNCDLVDLVVNDKTDYHTGSPGADPLAIVGWLRELVIGSQSVTYSGVLRPRRCEGGVQ